MTRPSAEMNDPEPPALKRTEDFCRCSSHLVSGSKPYLSLRYFLGGLLKSHSPSSERIEFMGQARRTRIGIKRFMTVRTSGWSGEYCNRSGRLNARVGAGKRCGGHGGFRRLLRRLLQPL